MTDKKTTEQFSLEGVKVELAIKKGAVLRFANPDVYMVARTTMTKQLRLVKSAEYLGDGKWMMKEYKEGQSDKEVIE